MAKAFPTDNPFLRGYYGPVNTEADAGHLPISGENSMHSSGRPTKKLAHSLSKTKLAAKRSHWRLFSPMSSAPRRWVRKSETRQ